MYLFLVTPVRHELPCKIQKHCKNCLKKKKKQNEKPNNFQRTLNLLEKGKKNVTHRISNVIGANE